MNTAVPPAVAAKPLRRGLITLSTMLAAVMQALDTTIANVALPHMQGSLQTSQDQITWVLTSYIVATAIAMPLTGWLCARFGRRRVFLAAVVGFTAASVLCGMAMNLSEIVAARVLQGVFGASLVPLSQAVLLDINPPEKVGQAMAIWGAGIMVGPILGPMLGGWITEHLDWRWVFYINLPIGVLAWLGLARYLPESKPRSEPLDLLGFVTLSLAIGLLQLCLDRGQQLDWFESTEIRLEAAGCVVAFAFFVAHTWTAQGSTFFNPALLRDRNFTSGLVFNFLMGMIMFASLALLPSLLQGLLGYSVVYTGEITAPRGAGTMLALMVVGRLVHRFDGRKIMALGFLITAYSLYQTVEMTLDMDSSLILWSGIVQGIGIGVTFVPLNNLTFATLAPHLRNEATPIYNLFRSVGSSVGVSMIQTLLTVGMARAYVGLSADISMSNSVVRSLGAPLDPQSALGLSLLNAEVGRQAAMMAYIDNFYVMMWLTLAMVPMLVFVRRTGRPDAAKPAAAAETH